MLFGTGNCLSNGLRSHKVRDFPNFKGQYKGSNQQNGSNDDVVKKNCFYALRLEVNKSRYDESLLY